MAKLKLEKIKGNDLVDYLNSSSDFGFELSVLRMLRENELDCEHGGLYVDPVSGKSREFDVRAVKTIRNYRVRLAVECKNIRENYPILISCIPRHESESYHQISIVSEPVSEGGMFGVPSVFQSRAEVLNLQGKYSIYQPGEYVGKSTVQVGRLKDESISIGDNEIYDKWSQCLSSSNDLISRMYSDGEDDKGSFFFSLVLPIVAVPNGRLWSVNYDYNGKRVSEPSLVDHCSCFIGKEYEMGSGVANTKFNISHMEIMTLDGLASFVDDCLKTESGISQFFSEEGISAKVIAWA